VGEISLDIPGSDRGCVKKRVGARAGFQPGSEASHGDHAVKGKKGSTPARPRTQEGGATCIDIRKKKNG